MRIFVFASDSNPAIDRPLLKKSPAYCEGEVMAGRARKLSEDIRSGIQLLASSVVNKPEQRGSIEQRGCLTAHEASLNADYQPKGDDYDQAFSAGLACELPDVEVPLLTEKFEHHLERHLLKGRRGVPSSCNVIAARVKTILSNPVLA